MKLVGKKIESKITGAEGIITGIGRNIHGESSIMVNFITYDERGSIPVVYNKVKKLLKADEDVYSFVEQN